MIDNNIRIPNSRNEPENLSKQNKTLVSHCDPSTGDVVLVVRLFVGVLFQPSNEVVSNDELHRVCTLGLMEPPV